MSYEDPIESISAGFVKGLLEWTSESVKDIVQKFKNKKLAFIQDEETIKIVKEQYNSGELNFYKAQLYSEPELLFLVKMGLTLRKLEGNIDRRQNLRHRIMKKYEIRGLHIAQFVENGLLNRYVGILIENMTSMDSFKKKIFEILNNIDKHVLFVKMEDNERNIVEVVKTKVFANSPDIFILSGISSAAEVVRKCEINLTKLLTDYQLERISSGGKENLFYKRL